MASDPDYEQAELRFKLAQKALEDFTQENIRLTLAGSEFISDSNAHELSRRLAGLRDEYDRAGREWNDALRGCSGKMTATASTALQMTASGSTTP